ncbi:acyltransferase family protein [Sphingomonas sp.]|uniref:acyltransferase family protein n=1 Tax=Sphingomonas sp. TaxID=28214 RepID=UPI0025FB8A70|nr:acyltransferase [Sphingomonas sp.]
MTGADTPARLDWLDIARGIGIVLVATGHALGGIIDSPMGAGRGDVRTAFFVIYTFHMPLFFILSGAMVARRVNRNRGDFAGTLVSDLVWPYFLWSTIQFTLILTLGGLVNHPITALWPTLSALWSTPISQFWFLYALFILHGIAILTLKLLGRDGFLLLCLALKPLGMIVAMPLVLRLAANQAPWYGIGVFLAAQGLADLLTTRRDWVRAIMVPVSAAVLIACAFVAAPGFYAGVDMQNAAAPVVAGLAWNMAVFPAGLLGAFAVIGIAAFDMGKIGQALAFLGRRSMPIFILHIMCIACVRIVATKFFGVTDLRVLLPLMIVFGLAGPLVAFQIAARLGCNRWLGLGRF